MTICGPHRAEELHVHTAQRVEGVPSITWRSVWGIEGEWGSKREEKEMVVKGQEVPTSNVWTLEQQSKRSPPQRRHVDRDLRRSEASPCHGQMVT